MFRTAGTDSAMRKTSAHLVRAPRLLCIDDDPNILESFRRRFRRQHIHAFGADSGQLGYSMAIHQQPDAIITDLRMPDGSGRWLLYRLKRNKRTEEIPVIVLTGVAGRELQEIAFLLGAEKYLQKPVPFQKLLSEVRPYLGV